MPEVLVAPFALPFMGRALAVMLVLSVAAAMVGVLVNLRRLEFLSDGLVHAVFPGVVIGNTVAGSIGLYIGGALATVVAAIVLTLVSRRGVPDDAAVAVVLTSMFSLGVIVVSEQRDYVGQLSEILFGRVLTVTADDVVVTTVVAAAAVAVVVVTGKEQVLRAFDRTVAEASGYRVLALDIALNVAVALVVVAASRALGTLLTLAVLIIPVAAARLLAARLGALVLVAVAVGALGAWLGLALSYASSVNWGLALPGGASVVLVLLALLLAALAVAGLRWRTRA